MRGVAVGDDIAERHGENEQRADKDGRRGQWDAGEPATNADGKRQGEAERDLHGVAPLWAEDRKCWTRGASVPW